MHAERDAIIGFLDDYMQIDRFHDSLPIGLQVEGRPVVRRVATGVSACAEVFRRAAEWNADMVLVHHGMFWERESRVLRGMRRERIKILLDHDMTLVAYHLPLDAHPEIGNNVLFAREVGLRNIEPFAEYHGNLIGYKGQMDPVPVEDFVARAAQFYGCDPSVAILAGPESRVASAGVVSGGAWDNIRDAIDEGLDVFVTGTADEAVYHIAREEGIHFLAFGHNATERVGVRALGEKIAEEFEIETRFFDVENPL